jgi:hypothetical protein
MSHSYISSEVLLNASELEAADTHYSNSRVFHDCTGTACCLIVVTGDGTVTITQQCSTDNVTWYDPETASAAAGAVEDSITATAGRYLSFTPVLCPYIRFKVVETGEASTATVSITLLYRVEV